MAFISLNGKLHPETTPVITAGNTAFKYGEGIFETMLIVDGAIRLQHYHLQRALSGLALLQIQHAPEEINALPATILQLCAQNNCLQRARARVSFFATHDRRLNYLIEANPLPAHISDFNKTGWQIELYTAAQKTIDSFSNAKTANYLPYLVASHFAVQNNLDEVVLQNARGNVCDGSKTNVFLVKNRIIYTPSLTEGCIAGVLRRYLIERLLQQGISVQEQPVLVKDLEEADELFFTNALQGIKWAARFRHKEYTHLFTKKIAELVFGNQN